MNPAQPLAIEPNQTVRLVNEQGQAVEMRAADLMQAHNDMQAARNSGFDLYHKGLQGDHVAAQQYMARVEAFARSRGVSTTNPVQNQTANTPPVMTAQEAAEIKNYVRGQQAEQVRSAVTNMITTDPKYAAIARMPNATNYAVNALIEVNKAGRNLDPATIHGVLKAINDEQAAYQESIIAPYKSRTGEPGVDDPFRDDAALYVGKPRPNPVSQPKEWKAWLGAGWRHALRQNRMAQAQYA